MSRKEKLLNLLKTQYYEQNPQMAVRDTVETVQMAPLLEKLVAGLQYVTPIKGKDYFTEAEIGSIVSYIHSMIRVPQDGATGPIGPQGAQGEQGITGIAGKTPVRGVDYFTLEDVQSIAERAAELVPTPKAPVLPDIKAIALGHVEDKLKDIPNQDSVVAAILKHPVMRVLLHGGGGGSTGTTVDDEIVSGNGTAWTLAGTPVGKIRLYALGQRLKLTTDYTITGSAITTVSSWNTGELQADYHTA